MNYTHHQDNSLTLERPSRQNYPLASHELQGDRMLVVIDPGVKDAFSLVAGVQLGAEVLILDLNRDGVEQITAALKQRTNLSSLHLVAHGTPGCLQLGSTQLSLDTLGSYFNQLQSWSKSLRGASLLLYGCRVAFGEFGCRFIELLYQLTGANIAASTMHVGNPALGGAWELETRLGQVESELAFLPEVRLAYAGVFEPGDRGMGLPLVSLITGPDFLVKSEGTKSAHVFNVTGTLPQGGLTVSVSAPNLTQFDLDAIEVIDGEITAVREDGFDFRITDLTAVINLPVADDGENEGLEEVTFTLEPGEGYEVNPEFSNGSFNLVDTINEVPSGTLSEPNDIIPLAIETGLSPENPSYSVTSTIDFEIGNRYENQDGTFTYVDYTEDSDLYSLELNAGDTIAVDVDAGQLFTGIDPQLRVFNAEGTELAVSDDISAPDEIFVSRVDPYLEFTAEEDGTYYVSVNHWDNSNYDPFTGGSGDGTVYSILGGAPSGIVGRGKYDLNINLVSEVGDSSGSDSSNNGGDGVSTGSGELIVSLQTITSAFDSDNNLLAPAIVESLEDGESVLTLILSAEGPLPEEGLEVTINSDIAGSLTDYFSVGFGGKPFSPGGEVLEAVYDPETGEATGIRFRLDQTNAIINLGVVDDGEEDGPQQVSFFLEPGEGYTVDSDASGATVTFYDNLEQVPAPTVVPEVGITVSEPSLVESEGTETTLTFNLSEAPSPEGILVYVDSGVEGALAQFDIFNVEVTGGFFPTPNSSTSGFYFQITEPTATINLSAFPDPFLEGLQEFTFSLQEDSGYTIAPNASNATISIADTPNSQVPVSVVDIPEQVPPPPITPEPNDTISDAFATNLSPENPNFSISGNIFNDFDSELDGSRVRDASEDVDFYSFFLKAGDTVTTDIDSVEYEASSEFTDFELPQRLDSELRLFDADGNELLRVNNAPAPAEEAGRDPYLEFTAEEAGTYYVGVSQLGNRNYDPSTEGSGSGWVFPDLGIYTGPYEIEISLFEGVTPDISGTDEPDELVGTQSNEVIDSRGGKDLAAGGLGDDTIFGGAGEDVLRGDLNNRSPGGTIGGDDIIYGGAGSDRIGGKAGDDTLKGGSGDDLIWGDDGDDLIKGGLGNDTLDGDASSVGTVGRDTFVLAVGEGTDTILDFQVGEDLIGLAEGLTFGQLSITQDGNNAVINFEDETLAIINRVGATTLTSDLFTPVV